MKKRFAQFNALLLAMLVVFSTLSFSVHKHYCGPFLKDVSVIVPGDGCGMEMSKSDRCDISKKSKCCNDDSELVQGQDELKTPVTKDLLIKGPLFVSDSFNYLVEFSGYEFTRTHYKKYQPPLVVQDIPVMHQSFLL